LLETDQARAMVETAQERGYLELAELEAFAIELDLSDDEVEELTSELERIGLEIATPAAAATACSSSSPTWAGTSCSPPPTR
jgi:hypothetical protein